MSHPPYTYGLGPPLWIVPDPEPVLDERGQETGETEQPSPYWGWPAGTVGVIDLRGLPDCGRTGEDALDKPVAFVASTDHLPAEYATLGTGDLREIAVTGRVRDAWESYTGSRPVGDVLLDLLLAQLTTHSDPTGETPTPPLMPSRGKLEIWLPGHSRVWQERFRFGEHPHTARVADVIQRAYQRVHESDPDLARKMLDAEIAKYRLDPRDRAQWELLVPAKLRREVPGPLPRSTTISDDFDRANTTPGNLGTSAEGWTWSQAASNFYISDNQARQDNLDGTANSACRADSDLSASDQRVNLFCNLVSTGNIQFAGPAARFADNTTFYTAERLRPTSSLNKHYLKKCVSGTFTTLLQASTEANPQGSANIEHTVQGSTISGVFTDNGVGSGVLHTATDTAIPAGLRAGMTGRRVRNDNFVATDELAAFQPAWARHSNTLIQPLGA